MISFIIPTLDEAKSLDKLLGAISKYKGLYEIIISDGRSKDETIVISKKYTQKITVHEGLARQVIAAGRNAGAKLATGDYLIFFDADVYIPDINALVEGILKYFSEDPKLVALSGSLEVMPEYARKRDIIISTAFNYYCYIVNRLFGAGMVYGEFQVTKKDAFQKVGGFNDNLIASEDYELFSRLRKVGHVRFALDLVVYHTGRRIRKTGWPKLLFQWFRNWLFVIVFKRAFDKEWKEVRE